ncbi:Nck-associated protein [Klebsormidium nitens]|uniref:Nck-associated protein n=1 Tax=Klebsormidium nitens TaxID=105231 RepID=A0A1Y1I2Y0_KLENI|nr:Nck-associated protein [Klebsormidium nitens]|eukprot:GAQ83769.1 Nck-associated protein [Klebsormidium nitens]
MESSSTPADRADHQIATVDRIVEADDNARPNLLVRSISSGPGETRGELETAQGTFMFSPEGLQLLRANVVKAAEPDPPRSLEGRLAEATNTPDEGALFPSALQEGGGVVQAMQPPDARAVPEAVTPNPAPQPPIDDKGGRAPSDAKADLLAEAVSPDTLDSMLLEAGQESKAEPPRRTLFSIPVKQGPPHDVSMDPPSPGVAAALRLQKLDQLRSLRRNAEGLCTKLYTLCRLCAFGPPDPGGARMASPKGGAISVDSFLFGGGQILPEHPKLRALLVKRFPEHPRMLNLDKVDRSATEALFAASGSIQRALEPWCQVLVDLMTFTEQSIVLLDELSRRLIALSPDSNALVMEAFLDLFVAVVRVNMLAGRVPRKLLLQVHALAHYNSVHSSESPVDPGVFSFVAAYESPVLALQRDLETIGPRVGEVLDAIAPQLLSLLNIETVRQDGVLSPWPKEGDEAPVDLPSAQKQYNASPAVKPKALLPSESTPIRGVLPSTLDKNRAGTASDHMDESMGEVSGAALEASGPALEGRLSRLALGREESVASGVNSPLPPIGVGNPEQEGSTPERPRPEEGGAEGVMSSGGAVGAIGAAEPPSGTGQDSNFGGDESAAMSPGGQEAQSGSQSVTQPSPVDFSKMGLWMGDRGSERPGEALQAEGLKSYEAHLQWVCFGFLACPAELARGVPRSDLRARLVGAVLSQAFLVPLFRNECIYVHEEYAQYVLPRLADLEKQAKSQRGDVDEERAAKAARKAIKNAADGVAASCGPIHRERRVVLHEELEKLATAFSEVPGLLPQKVENVLGALSLARTELHWHFHHLGVPAKARAGRILIPEGVPDATVGSLLSVTQKLAAVVKEYRKAIRSYAASKLLEARERVQFFSGLALAGLDVDSTLKKLLKELAPGLEEDYLTELVKGGSAAGSLQAFQRTWIRTLGLLSNSKSSVNLRHLELATSQGMVPGLARECNRAYQLARCVDELDALLDESSSLKVLHFYQPKLLLVLQQTLYDPQGFCEDACAWLRLADAFPQNAHKSVPQELPKLAVAAVEYTESVLEFLMAGLQSMVGALDSESGWAGLDRQISAERAVLRLTLAAQAKSSKRRSTPKKEDLQLSQQQPGFESDPSASDAVQGIEVAVQRLTSFVAELGNMGPVKVMDRVYAPREYLRERLHSIIKAGLQENYLAGLKSFRPPQLLENDLRRFEAILQLIGRHVSIDVTRVLREVLLSEAYTDRMRDLQPPVSKKDAAGEGPKAVAAVIADWYIDFIVLDLRNAGIIYSQSTSGFTTGGHSTALVEQVTRLEAFESLLRVFGPYGADRLIAKTYEITTLAILSLEATIRKEQPVLQELQANFHFPEKRARLLSRVTGIENVYALTTQVGQCISLREQVADACAAVMKQHAPLIHTVLGDAVRCLPPPLLPEGVHAARLRRVAHKVGAADRGDDPLVYQALTGLGKVGDATWRLLPVLWATCTGSSFWKTAHFDARTQAFSNNAHCFAKGLQAVLACAERVGFERRELQYQLENARIKMLTSEGGNLVEQPTESDEASDVSTGSPLSEVVRGQLGKYVAFTVALTLADWDGHGAPAEIRPVMTKLIFLDQLCELSPHLSRSTLEQHVPHTLLRSIYQAEYTLQALPVNTQVPAAVQSGKGSSMTARLASS